MTDKIVYQNLILNDDELVVATIRQSMLLLGKKLIIPIIMIIGAFFLLYPLFSWGDQGMVIFFALIVVGIIGLMRLILIWYWQILVITNQRVIDVDRPGLFQKIVSETDLTNVQDVVYKSRGLVQILAKIGTIKIKLADQTTIEVQGVSKPRVIQQLILRLKAEFHGLVPSLDNLTTEQLIMLLKNIRNTLGEQQFAKAILKDFE
ncbi:MAG: PH domain-containing protein [Candidatus Buchananbacteria bacterium]|nr:PH domain-containing protein [Candidatus Buchananbacteria bacterium]